MKEVADGNIRLTNDFTNPIFLGKEIKSCKVLEIVELPPLDKIDYNYESKLLSFTKNENYKWSTLATFKRTKYTS